MRSVDYSAGLLLVVALLIELLGVLQTVHHLFLEFVVEFHPRFLMLENRGAEMKIDLFFPSSLVYDSFFAVFV